MIVELVDGRVTAELRRAVLRPSWPVGSAMHGDGEPGVLHIAARLRPAGPVIGACVLFQASYPLREEPGSWQLRGMATDPDQRGHGVGTAVLAEAVAQVARRGGRFLWCQARVSAIDFYARRGLRCDGQRFDHAETGIEHVMMWQTVGEPFPAAGTSTP